MKKLFSMFTAVLLSAAAFQAFGQEQEWVNYSNFTAVTDVEPVGDHLWITAKGGVVDMNTTTLEKTYYKKGDAGLPSSLVEQVAVDATSGTIWVGTYDAGVVEWDGENWLSYDYPTYFLMYRMKFDGFGDLWLQTDAGLYKFDSDDHSYTFINSIGGAGWDFDAWDFDITSDNKVLIFTGEDCLVIDAATNMAIDSFPNTESPVVLGCSPATVRIYGVNADTYLINNSGSLEFQFKDGTYAPAMEGLPEFGFINNITRGTDDNLYLLINSTEIYKLNGLTWEFVNSLGLDYSDKLQFTDGTSFYVNSGDYMAPPTVIKLNATKTTYATQQYNFTSNGISGIVKGADDNIFIASGTSIYQFNAVTDNWDLEVSVPTIYNSMYDLRYYNDMFYVVDNGNLLEYYDGTTWTHIPMAAGYSSVYVFDYDVTADGIVYFINEEGLFKYEAGVTTNLIETGGVASWFISVVYDDMRNLIWLGRTNGIVKYDFVTQDVINATDFPALAEGSSIQEIKQDAAGNIWFGANSGKLYRFDGTDWSDFTASAVDDFVVNINFHDNKVYCGMNGTIGGLWIYDLDDASETNINTLADPLMPSNYLSNFLVTATGDIWIAHTDVGVSVLRTVVEPDGVEDLTVNNMVAYPNPAKTVITFEAANATAFQILDLNGRVLINSNIATINIENLAAGIYLAKAIDANNMVSLSRFTVIK